MKVSSLPEAGPLSGSEEIPVTQDGVSKKVYAYQFSSTGAVADHEAKLDPHPQYLNDARGDERYIKKSESGVANGVAPLDETGKVSIEFLPDLPAGRKVVVADEAERLALPIHNDLTIAYQQSDSTVWGLNSSTNPAVAENWQFLGSTAVDGVVSFNSRAGVVVPETGDYNADQITETVRKFVTDAEKSSWNAKLDEASADIVYVRKDQLTEDTQDIIGSTIVAGTNITLVYDDEVGTLTVNAVGGGDVSSVNGQTGVVVLDASDVGADPQGTASDAVAAHVNATDPHPEYLKESDADTTYQRLDTFSDSVMGVVGTKVVAGTNVTVDYDPLTKEVTIGATGGSGSVDSVNGQTGIVVLTAADVGAAEEVHSHTSLDVTDFQEAVQDIVGSTVVGGSNVSVQYDDELGTVTVNASVTAAVDSVNGQVGDVVLTHDDVGAAAEVHTHVASDVTDFDDSAVLAVSESLVAGQHIDISYSPTTKKITIQDQGNDTLMIWQGI